MTTRKIYAANPSDSMRSFVTVSQACGALNVSRYKIQKLHEEGRLELVRVGKAIRVTERSLTAYVDQLLTGDSAHKKPPQGEHDEEDDGH